MAKKKDGGRSRRKTSTRSTQSKRSPKPRRRSQKRDATIHSLRRYIRTEGLQFLRDPNVTSIGIGYKIRGGERTGKLSLQFTVASKAEPGIALESLGTELIPESVIVDGARISTDVIERRFEPAFQLAVIEETDLRKKRVDPVFPGVSISHHEGSAGTLGMIVYDRQSGDPCGLSNWHVLDRPDGEIGDTVVQPGPFDDNRVHQNRVGTLLRSHLGHAGDCAIVRLEDREVGREIWELGTVPTRAARVDLGDVVVKSGRTTGVTIGVVRRTDVIAVLDYPGVGPTEIGCFEIGPMPGSPATLEISMGGDSGSTWLIADDEGQASDILAGLHFAGERSNNPDEHALACYAHSVFQKLDISFQPLSVEELPPALGYDSAFLATEAKVPWLSDDDYADTVKVDGSHLIPYQHFSVCLSMEHGLARFVAWNIDGGRIKRLSRSGIDFERDPRVPEEFQHGNELYRHNPLDRGHLARRADLTWGSLDEAQRANVDSFFYTNIAPQHQSFNQSSRGGLWGELENAVLEEVRVEDLRVSVMGGPIFRPDDPLHRGVRIPRDFWKLVAYTDSADGLFKVRAYVLTQRDLLTDLEALELDPFRVYQVSTDRLREETGLTFRGLGPFDTFKAELESQGGPSRSERLRTAGGAVDAREVVGRRAPIA